MAKLSESAVQIYQEYMDMLRKLSCNLTSQPWFAEAPWFVSKGIYARGISLQLAQIHWHNHEGQGIHLETWIDADAVARKEVFLVMHVEPHVPNRAAFNEKFWRLAQGKLQSWEGFQLNENNAMELWKKRVPLSKTATALTEEFNRVKDLAPEIDRALKKSAAP
ncbi:hypothetical protein DB345_08530 [Spartobacteria bacterium LR76]|nr:hypothetical protein DB345_08530 [Spartobacteria bacterium LR76]